MKAKANDLATKQGSIEKIIAKIDNAGMLDGKNLEAADPDLFERARRGVASSFFVVAFLSFSNSRR